MYGYFQLDIESRLWDEQAWRRAFAAIGGRRAVPGIDKVDGERYEREFARRTLELARSVQGRFYRPGRLLELELDRPDGKKRPIAIPTLDDRLLQRLVLDFVTPLAEQRLADGVHGYRPGRSTRTAIEHLVSRTGENDWLELLVVDVEKLFERLRHVEVLGAARALSWDATWTWLVERWCRDWGSEGPFSRGLPQGAPLSPLLANLALAEHFDRPLEELARYGQLPLLAWVRYGDDIALSLRGKGAAGRALEEIERLLGRIELRVSYAKSQILDPFRPRGRLLGWEIEIRHDAFERCRLEAREPVHGTGGGR